MYFDKFNLEQYKPVLDNMVATILNEQIILVIGNGGSLSMASHMVTDLMLLGKLSSSLSDPSVLTALSNDFSYEEVYARQISLWPKGVLIAISSSGNSPNILCAVRKAKDMNFTVFTFSGFSASNALSAMGDLNIHVPQNDYGIVESSHAIMLHYIINECKI